MKRLAWSLVACCGLVAFWGASPGDDLARELPRIPPTEPQDAQATFRLHEGFRLLTSAAEPLVTDPVAACYDADGRLYVVEMRGYPYADDVPPGTVRLLQDLDGDGRFDQSSVFLTDLSWPTSVVPYDGGVFVAAPPEILYAKDTDGDGKADIRRVAFRGFGTQNVQALVNGLLWGPDGWIYGAGGPNGGDILNLARPNEPPVSVRGRDFRFRPDGSAFEAISGGGQFGHTFDDWGHRFVCSNSNHIRQIVLPAAEMARNSGYSAPAPVIDIAVEGGAGPVFRISPPEPWRVVRTRQRAADPNFVKRAPASELVAIGFFTSATGVTIYRGSAYPEPYRGNAFIGDVGGNLVHRKIVERASPIFRARRADEGVEFLASTDNWFRPVNFVNTPSGTLLLLDMYRETIEHPASIPDPIKRHLDLTSGHDRGRLYELLPATFTRRSAPRLGQASASDLVRALAEPDAWWRETAQRLLLERHDGSVLPALRELARARPSALGRLHALWTLDALGELRGEDLLPAFDDSEPGVREQAARLAARLASSHEAVRQRLVGLAQDADAMVRFQCALALGDVPGPESSKALAAIAARTPADDPWTRAAVLSGLEGRALPFLTQLDAMPGGFLRTRAGLDWLGELAALVGVDKDRDTIQALANRFTEADADPAQSRIVLLGLGKGLKRAGTTLEAVLRSGSGDRLATQFRLAADRAHDEAADLPARLAALDLLALAPADLVLATMPPLLSARQPATIQVGALQALNGQADKRVGTAVVAQWSNLGPAARREALEVLFARKERREALIDALESKAIAPTDLDTARQRQLLDDPDQATRARVGKLLAGSGSRDRAKVIDSFRAALEKAGDLDRGRQIFTKACATCHRAEGKGIAVGPDLVTVANRTAEDLLIHVLDPNREVAPNYVNYTLATTDGRVLSGMIADESGTTVTLKRAEGVTESVVRTQIEAITATGLSLMPEGLEKDLKPDDLADLIAFVRGLK